MANNSPAIRPFRIDIPDGDLTDLRERLARTRWPERECVPDWTQGIPLDYTRELAAYWADGYDWRAREAALNRFDQFVTEIDGVDIHFIHQRCANPDALPLIITHGWPGSIVEFAKIIEPLAENFHVVCPSLPGYGFSGKPTAAGWNIERIATAWDTLMTRLGYERYGAQGGDWGAVVTTQIGSNASAGGGNGCIAIHTNMPLGLPTAESMQDPTPAEQSALEGLAYHQRWGMGYSEEQATRPQTLGYGLVDSPVAQMACRRHRPRPDAHRDARQRDAVLGDCVRRIVGAAVLGELQEPRRVWPGRGADRCCGVSEGDPAVPAPLV